MLIKAAEVQILRRRALAFSSMSTPATINWDPLNEGSYLDIELTGSGTVDVILWLPSLGPETISGMEIWVALDKQGGAGGSITWGSGGGATFRFQTSGDKLPNSSNNSLTVWHGFVRANNSVYMGVYMTKIGEWVAGGVIGP